MPDANVTVSVSLRSAGVRCLPDVIRVHRGESISWSCRQNYPFAIRWGERSPFPRNYYPSRPKQGIQIRVPVRAPLGRFKYCISVAHGDRIWIEDPQVIILP